MNIDASVGRIVAVEGLTVTFTARYSASRCEAYKNVASRLGLASLASIMQLGIDILAIIAAQGNAHPVDAPANDGPCEMNVTWPVSELQRLTDTAAAWGVTTDELHHLGGELILVIIYVLGLQGGGFG